MTTLADLIDSVVNGAGYRSPVVNAIANQRPDLPAVKAWERQQALANAVAGPQGNAQDQMAGAYAPQPAPTLDNGRYFGADAVAMTGLPQLRSGVQHAANSYALRNDPQASADEAGAALPDIALGGLGVLGMLGGSGESLSGPRAAPRLPRLSAEPVTQLPVNPTRELGRASDGSVLPVRPAQPFRQSMVGGSGDLRDAAAMGVNDGSHALDPGAMTALRRELREHDFPVPADTASLPAVDIPLGDLRPGRIGTADAADARQYAAMGSEAPPILVRRQGAGWHIIDGNRRAAAARIKGAPTVRALDATDLFRAQSVHNVGSDGATSLNSTNHAAVPLGIGLLGASQTRRNSDNRNTKAPRGAFFHGRSH